MELRLPPLPDLNTYINSERRNRFIAAKIKRETTELVAWKCKEQKIKPVTTISKLTLIWKEPNRRKDPDNIGAAVKFILDGMVTAGVFPTDSWKLWSGNPRINHRYEIDATAPGVVVVWK